MAEQNQLIWAPKEFFERLIPDPNTRKWVLIGGGALLGLLVIGLFLPERRVVYVEGK